MLNSTLYVSVYLSYCYFLHILINRKSTKTNLEEVKVQRTWFRISLSNCYATVLVSHISLDNKNIFIFSDIIVNQAHACLLYFSNMFGLDHLVIVMKMASSIRRTVMIYENTNLACSADFSILMTENSMLQLFLINPTSRSCPRVGMGLPGILMRCTMKYQ